jgi:hypothetical protein
MSGPFAFKSTWLRAQLNWQRTGSACSTSRATCQACSRWVAARRRFSTGGGEAYGFTIDGPTGEPVPVTPESGTYLVLPDFFETLGTRFVAGRPFTADDSRTSIVGNRTLAESLWPGEDPLSKHLNLGNNVLPALAPIGVEAEAVVGLVISPIDPCARYRRTKTAWKSSRRWS